MSSSSQTLNVEAEGVAPEQNVDDLTNSLAHGCLKLGDEQSVVDNDGVELQRKHRFAFLDVQCHMHVQGGPIKSKPLMNYH